MGILCRMCKRAEESVYLLVCACPVVAPTLYRNIRHNQLARIIHQEIAGIDKVEMKPPPVTHKDHMEILLDEHIKTVTKNENNRPGIIIWHPEKQLCQSVEITVPLDTILKKALTTRSNKNC